METFSQAGGGQADAARVSKLNRLRAAVLGANDGIVSVAAVIVGVAGAENTARIILISGIAATVAGALSMAAGEFVSVSAQRDAEAELGMDPRNFANPWHAAVASAAAFLAGSVIPLVIVTLPPPSLRVPVTFASVLVCLVATGALAAYAGGARRKGRAIFRVVVGGLLAMIVTYVIGRIFGVAGL